MTSQEDVIPEVCTAADSTVSYRYKRRQRQTFSITSVTARMVYLINEVMGKALTATLKELAKGTWKVVTSVPRVPPCAPDLLHVAGAYMQ